jgi:DNA/RNA-binding domain of Phe-tRNA-synthetase-like protein
VSVRFVADPVVFERIPGMRIAVAYAGGVSNDRANEGIGERWRRAWSDAGRWKVTLPNPQSHPNVRAWREAFRGMGASPHDYPSSIEALLRRAMKGGEPFSINPLVDLYNAISLERVAPVGGFDVGAVRGTLDLRVTVEGDRFLPLDGERAEAVPAGEVAYADGADVLTRHLLWRQSRRALIAPATRDVILLSEALPASPVPADEMAVEFARSLSSHLGVVAVTAVVDADTPSFEV